MSDTEENEAILAERPRFSWTIDGRENPAVPCIHCGSLELRILATNAWENGASVLLACRRCGGNKPMHLSIDERSLLGESSFVTITTD